MEVTRLFDIPEYVHTKYPKADILAGKIDKQWKKYSTQDLLDYSHNLAAGLLELGLQKDEKVALIANNRPEWNFADYGIQMAGGINVPIYPTISENDLNFILKDAEVKFVFVSSADLFKKVNESLNGVTTVKGIYTFNEVEGAKNWSEVLELGKKNPNNEKIGSIKSSIQPNDLATLIYTSGTTGNPKGVMLSHNNIFSNVYAARNLAPVDNTCRALSFLPLNHIYERMLGYYYLYLGVSIYYAESLDTIADNLKEVQPEIFTTVPRLLEKVYDKIVAKGNDLTGIKRKLFFWALDLGLKYELDGKNGWWYETQLKWANKLIFVKWREALGGKVRVIVAGGAALQERLARIFWAAQLPVLQGYGLTETSPVVAVNTLPKGGSKFGTVGALLEKVEVKIAADGEILVKGPNVMMGYYKRPDATAEAIDADGYFHTGDIGIMDEGKYLKITDRKKEIFKTSGGKYIAPQMIENKLKESPYIEQAMVVGENQKYAAALIVPAFAAIKDYCSKNGVAYTTNEEMIKNPKVLALIKEGVDHANKSLAQYESIKKTELLSGEFTINDNELTPKMSLKRKVIAQKYAALIDKMFVATH